MQPLVTVLAAMLLVFTEAIQPASSARSQTGFTATPCPFTIGEGLVDGRDVRCGYLTVPEDRSATSGRTIRLAVAIFTPRDRNPAPDPLIYLHGGPGAAIVASLGPAITRDNAASLVGRHGLILLDQRGAGLSRPSLDCPEVTTATYSGYAQQLSAEQQRQNVDRAVRTCHARLVHAGIGLDAYNTVENAADIADLREALGYKAINLYGGSYGTRLALQVMRDHPQGIRSAVLDAIADPTFNEFTDAIPNAWRSLTLVFRECAAATTCNTFYPRLEHSFDQAASQAQAQPIAIAVHLQGRPYRVPIDGAAFASLVMAALYASTLIPQVPQLIADTAHRDYVLLTRIGQAILSSQSPGQGAGAYFSTECSDDQAGATLAKISTRAAMLPSAVRAAVVADRAEVLTQCAIWHVKDVAPANRQLFASAIPTLLLNGQYDPRTPPDPAARLALRLKHGYYLLFPALGHGVWHTGTCPDSIVAAFLDHPARRPDTACIAQMPPAFQ